jgi:hypothetical protein
MPGHTLFNITVTVALIAGTAAGLLGLLTWEIFRTSPFGRALFTLTAVMAVFTLYHAVLLVVGTESLLVANLIKSAIFTGMAAFIGMIILSQRRLRRGSPG